MKPEDVIRQISDLEALFLTIYGEGRGESIEGQVAIANVIHNRMKQAKAGTTYKDVCLAHRQFSCWNIDDPNFPLLIEIGEKLILGESNKDIVLKQCICVARGIRDEEIMDNTHGALNYMTNKLFNSKDKPLWSLGAKIVKPIGNHSFLVV